MRTLAMTGIVTASMIPRINSTPLIRATPPAARMSAGIRSSAITATAPASWAIAACSGVTTSMMTPPLSICASPRLTVAVPLLSMSLFYQAFPMRTLGTPLWRAGALPRRRLAGRNGGALLGRQRGGDHRSERPLSPDRDIWVRRRGGDRRRPRLRRRLERRHRLRGGRGVGRGWGGSGGGGERGGAAGGERLQTLPIGAEGRRARARRRGD